MRTPSKSFLHIGKVDAIGQGLLQFSDFEVISHNELYNRDLERYEVISVSSFNPIRKREISRSCPFVNDICKLIDKKKVVIYFSSCRVIENDASNLSPYCENKRADEIRLSSSFPLLKVVYLPLLASETVISNNVFFNTFFSNLRARAVHFDVHQDSSWNFVSPLDISELITHADLLGTSQAMLSKSSVSARSMADFFFKKGMVDVFSFGPRRVDYPSKICTPVIFSDTDLGADISWLERIMVLYGS